MEIFTFQNQDETMGELLSWQLNQAVGITCGYNRPNPNKKEIQLYVTSDDGDGGHIKEKIAKSLRDILAQLHKITVPTFCLS
jgi:DNA-directed RNA polymerase subunit L